MVDIHTHLLFGADDGAGNINISKEILQDEASQGVTHVIATPHYAADYALFRYPRERIESSFEELREYAEETGISLYLGCEYHVDSAIVETIRSGRVHTLGDGKYVLMEFGYTDEYERLLRITEDVILAGFYPVTAHVERCSCIREKPERLKELRRMGALIQVNAGGVLGQDGFAEKKACAVILKEGMADIIASDVHNMSSRRCCMKQCFEHVEKKYGPDIAERCFISEPMKIIESIGGQV